MLKNKYFNSFRKIPNCFLEKLKNFWKIFKFFGKNTIFSFGKLQILIFEEHNSNLIIFGKIQVFRKKFQFLLRKIQISLGKK